MKKHEIRIEYQVHEDMDSLEAGDAELLLKARSSLSTAYAPYSRFRVGAAGRLADGTMLVGTNQENASFPAGLCAEGVLLATASAVAPEQTILSIAISYEGEGLKSAHPLAPCGVCRQKLVEFEERHKTPIRLILAGLEGRVFIFQSAADLLPIRFSGSELPG